MNQYRKEFGKFLRKQREVSGFSQSELAKKVGLKSSQSISNIERGVSPLPARHVFKLGKVLGLNTQGLAKLAAHAEFKSYVNRAVK